MNILFFSYLSHDITSYKGGGWIESLANTIAESKENNVAIAFLTSHEKTLKFQRGNITFYPIYHKPSLFSKLYQHALKKVEEIDKDNIVNSIIRDFSPNIIQLFGLETSFGSILKNIKHVPVVIHIQGICTAILDKWFPMGMSNTSVWWNSPFKYKMLFMTTSDFFARFIERAKIEQRNYKIYKYYLGRTKWDFSVSRILAPMSKYYKCDEVLRPEFYGKKWSFIENKKIVIATTMNGDIYKGLDTILRTANILKSLGLNIEWNIYGITNNFALKNIFEKFVKLKFEENNIYFSSTLPE